MKAEVINKASEHFGSVIDVCSINYNCITGFIEDGYKKIKINYDEAKFKFDSEWEKDAVKYRDLFNIKAPASSMKFYAALCYAIEQHFNFEIKSIVIVNDINEKVRKNYWYKNIECIINNTRPINIRVLGREYSDIYDISIEDIDGDKFTARCSEGIFRLRRLIEESSEKLAVYERVLKGMNNHNEKLKLKQQRSIDKA